MAVVSADDAWVLSNEDSRVGITHWTGTWNTTSYLGRTEPVLREPLAIWAPAKDDVWVTARNSVWHLAGGEWREIATGTTYRSIHGSGPTDVWFAGDDGVAHWDGTTLSRVAGLVGKFTGVWASARERVWLWGERSILFDGTTSVPVETALHVSVEWNVRAIAEVPSGDVFVLTKSSAGATILWFDATHSKLVDVIASDLDLTTIRGRGDRLWAIGEGGACLAFAPALVR